MCLAWIIFCIMGQGSYFEGSFIYQAIYHSRTLWSCCSDYCYCFFSFCYFLKHIWLKMIRFARWFFVILNFEKLNCFFLISELKAASWISFQDAAFAGSNMLANQLCRRSVARSCCATSNWFLNWMHALSIFGQIQLLRFSTGRFMLKFARWNIPRDRCNSASRYLIHLLQDIHHYLRLQPV